MELTYRQVAELQNAMQGLSEMTTVGDLQLDLQLAEWMVELDKKIGIVQTRVTAFVRQMRLAEKKKVAKRRPKRQEEEAPEVEVSPNSAPLTLEEEERVRQFQEEQVFPLTCTINLPPLDGHALRACGTIKLGQLAYLRPILSFDGLPSTNSKGE